MLKPLLVAALALFATSAAAQNASPEQLCDQFASHPWEPGRNGRGGVEWDRLDVAQAIPACEAALAAYPDAPEIKFRLARALVRSGDLEKGLPLMLEAAQAGYSAAEAAYGSYHMPRQVGPTDPPIALEWLRKGAEHGHPAAQRDLAIMLMDGVGTPVQLVEAFNWAKQSAEADFPLSMSLLGSMYELGMGVERNYERANAWYSKGAARSDAVSYYALARALQLGRGVRHDPKAAFNWWESYAMGGDRYAQLVIAAAYEDGVGVAADVEAAKRWYTYATTNNYGPAMLAMGRLLLTQATTAEETAVALSWLHRAALNEQYEAYVMLAEHYEAAGDFRSATEMAELAVYFSQGPLARLGQAVIDRVGDKASWPTTPGRYPLNTVAKSENRPGNLDARLEMPSYAADR